MKIDWMSKVASSLFCKCTRTCVWWLEFLMPLINRTTAIITVNAANIKRAACCRYRCTPLLDFISSKVGVLPAILYIYIYIFEMYLYDDCWSREFSSPYRRNYSFFLRNCLWIGMETYAAGMHAENHITFVIMFQYSSFLIITNVTNLFILHRIFHAHQNIHDATREICVCGFLVWWN